MAKLCDFGLARNMSPGTQVVTSIKGTPLYMAPEVLDNRGYSHSADLWSLGCIIFEMLMGETPFVATSILELVRFIQVNKIIYPSFISKSCRNFLQRLLVYNPQDRMTWQKILEHDFVKGHIFILKDDEAFAKPQDVCDQQQSDKIQHTKAIARIKQLKNRGHGAIDDVNVVSSRDSINVNLNMQSDMEHETDNEELLMLKDDSDESETSVDDQFDDDDLVEGKRPSVIQMIPGQLYNFQQFQKEAPRLHNIANFQPVAENPNMVMHRFMDNLDPELQNFMMTPAMMMAQQFPMFPPVTSSQKAGDDNFSLRIEKSTERPTAQSSLMKSEKTTQSDGISTDASMPVETEEWMQFLFKTMQEILDGDLETYKQGNMMMIVGLLRNRKFNSKLMDHVVQIICLPYVIDMPASVLEDIEKLYLQIKLVPNLIFASKLLCSKTFHQSSMDTMLIPKVDKMIHFNRTKLKTLSTIYDLVVYLVHSNGTFLAQLCDAIQLLNIDDLFRSFLGNATDGESNDGERLTASVIALISAILQELPEMANLVEKLIFHEDFDLCVLLRHENATVRLRTCLLLRLLGRFCCFSLQNQWSHKLSSGLEELTTQDDDDVRKAAENVIEEFKECLGWFKTEDF